MCRYIGLALGLLLVSGCSSENGERASHHPENPQGAGGPIKAFVHAVDVGHAPPTTVALQPKFAGSPEPCNGFDDNGDGRVDENCSCSAGQVQACFPWKKGDAPVCAPAGQQNCATTGAWTECVMKQDAVFDSLCSSWVTGKSGNDQLELGADLVLGDANGDGDADIVLPSANAGAYVVFGSPHGQGFVFDLATQALTGQNGFSVDNPAAQNGYRPARALFGDFDGDGFSDVIGIGSASSLLLVRGSNSPQASYGEKDLDGVKSANLGGATASSSIDNLSVFDFDGDGFFDAFAGGSNDTPASDACSPFGLAVWFGRSGLSADVATSASVPSGMGCAGTTSHTNHTRASGFGDFDNDGYLDLAAAFGATKDCQSIPETSYVWYGNPERALPSTMNALNGENGGKITGGSSAVFDCTTGGSYSVSGLTPSDQHGDFNGDGIDDLLLVGHAGDAFVVFGKAGRLGSAETAVSSFNAGVSFVVPDLASAGAGDVDADGFDDIVFVAPSQLVVWWGRADASGVIDPTQGAEAALIPYTKLGDAGGLLSDAWSPQSVSVGDVDGDGFADVLLGFPAADTKNGKTSGAGVVIFGAGLFGLHSPNALRRGGGNDSIAAADEDLIVAGRGDDVIDAGASKAIYAGQGMDRIRITNTAFRRIHGGFGIDSLALAGALSLDFRSIGRARVQEIEHFDLEDPAKQSLAFNAGDLSAMSTTSRDFWVTGGAEDSLTLEGGFVEIGSDFDGFTVFSHGALSVHVSAKLAKAVELLP